MATSKLIAGGKGSCQWKNDRKIARALVGTIRRCLDGHGIVHRDAADVTSFEVNGERCCVHVDIDDDGVTSFVVSRVAYTHTIEDVLAFFGLEARQ